MASTKARTKKHGRSSIRIEFHVRVKHNAKVQPTAALIQEMITYWVETGEEPGGVHIEAVTWQHKGKPERRAERDSNALEDVRANMLKRFIHSMPIHVQVLA